MVDDGFRHRIDARLEAERADDDAREQEPGGPFRLLVAGDFRGRAWQDEPDAALPDPVRVDRDTFDDVMARLAPRVDLGVPPNGQSATMGFRELDDFHPDRLYERQPYFRFLAEEWRKKGAAADVPAGPPVSRAPDRPRRMTSELFEEMLAEADADPAPDAAASPYDLQAFLKRSLRSAAAAPTPTLDEKNRQRVFASVVEGRLRGVMHHPAFRAVESLWRALDLLVRRVPDDVAVQVSLLDVTRDELRAGLAGGGRWPAGRWSVHVLLDDVGDAPDDVALLEAIAAAAERARTPWIVGAASGALGIASAEAAEEPAHWTPPSAEWNRLRALPGARRLAIVGPRVVVRMPYGRQDDPCERVEFEEMRGAEPGAYLWASGALAAAVALARGVEEDGGPSSRRPFVFDGLPLPLVRSDDAPPEAVPVTEWLLTERGGSAAAARGVSPLLAARDADRLLLPGLRSIAASGEPLVGPWGPHP